MNVLHKLRQLFRTMTGRRDQAGDLPLHQRRKRRQVEWELSPRDIGDRAMMRGGGGYPM